MNSRKFRLIGPVVLSALVLAGGCRTGIQGLNTGFTKGLNDAVAAVVEALVAQALAPLVPSTGP